MNHELQEGDEALDVHLELLFGEMGEGVLGQIRELGEVREHRRGGVPLIQNTQDVGRHRLVELVRHHQRLVHFVLQLSQRSVGRYLIDPHELLQDAPCRVQFQLRRDVLGELLLELSGRLLFAFLSHRGPMFTCGRTRLWICVLLWREVARRGCCL